MSTVQRHFKNDLDRERLQHPDIEDLKDQHPAFPPAHVDDIQFDHLKAVVMEDMDVHDDAQVGSDFEPTEDKQQPAEVTDIESDSDSEPEN